MRRTAYATGALLMVISCAWLMPTQRTAGSPTAGVPQWEYKLVDSSQPVGSLNDLGLDGWQLTLGVTKNGNTVQYVFMRSR